MIPPGGPKKKRLDQWLVAAGLASDVKQAQALIMAGQVVVNDQRARHAGELVPESAKVRTKQKRSEHCSRAGDKLRGAVAEAGLEKRFTDAVVLDVGASTGGFTDCALRLGARQVIAVDVGTNQLAWELRNDPRVISWEKTDIRTLQADQLPDFQVVTVDVSFISVTTILPALNAIVCAKQNLTGLPVLGVFLVKPQFEIPKQDLPDGGVVSDPRSRQQAVDRVQQTLAKVPFHVTKVLPSRVVGKSGNQEYFVIGDYQVSESPLPVLFLCTGNSCRSQMAEGWCRHLHGKALPCLSAGTEKHGMNPYAIKVMAEVGIDLNQQHSKTLDDLGDQKFATIYTVCDAAADNCPVVPGARVVRQTFDDPPKLTAAMSDEEEKLAVYRRVRDEIKAFVAGLV